MHGNNVDATALLGDSEVFAVKHTPADTVPEFVQRLEYDCEVSSSVAREKAVHVLEDNGSWTASSNEAHKLVKESRLASPKPRSRPHSRQREILAGEACRPDIRFRDLCIIELPYVMVYGEIRPMLAEDRTAERVDLAVEADLEPGPLKTEVQASDAGEE